MNEFCFQVTEELQGMRIDAYMHEVMDTLSRSYIQKLIKEDGICVNDKMIKTNSYRVKTGDAIRFMISDAVEPDILPENIPLSILYEDKDLLVVDKPKGMVVHPAAGHYSGTLVNAVLYYCKEDLSGINGVMRPGIVHRIDMDTTGSLIVCKNDETHNAIALQLKEHSITRKYRAICCGVISEEEGTVNAPIGRHPTDRKKMSIHSSHGKEAVTHYRVLQRFAKYTYIECILETGRTHQIRVHMASIGHPLLGDIVYADRKRVSLAGVALQGQTLHAMTIGFRHPRTGSYIEVEAPLPEYFEHLLHIL